MGHDVKHDEVCAHNERLKATIAAYWIEQGYMAPEFYEAYCGNHASGNRTPVFRTDMINGLPRRKK